MFLLGFVPKYKISFLRAMSLVNHAKEKKKRTSITDDVLNYLLVLMWHTTHSSKKIIACIKMVLIQRSSSLSLIFLNTH